MKRKPASRRPKAEAPKKKVFVGVEMNEPTREQLAMLKKLFTPRALASIGIGPRAIVTIRAPLRKRPRR